FWSRTLVPTMAKYMLKEKSNGTEKARKFDVWFEAVRERYKSALDAVVHHRKLAIPVVLVVSLLAFLLVPWLGQDFFPEIDSGQFQFHLRARPGTRVE